MTHNEIKSARRKLGLTQRQLGDRLGIAAQTVRRWEMDPRHKSARKINPTAARVIIGLVSTLAIG